MYAMYNAAWNEVKDAITQKNQPLNESVNFLTWMPLSHVSATKKNVLNESIEVHHYSAALCAYVLQFVSVVQKHTDC